MKRFCVKTVACQAPRPHDMHTISEVRGVRRQQLRDQMFQSTPPRGGRQHTTNPYNSWACITTFREPFAYYVCCLYIFR